MMKHYDPERTWAITFGSGHLLGADYCVVMTDMSQEEARKFIHYLASIKWSFMYSFTDNDLEVDLAGYYIWFKESGVKFRIFKVFTRDDLPGSLREHQN